MARTVNDLSLVSLASTFTTTGGQPLTDKEIFYSLSRAESFAQSDSAYVGQKITVVENDVVSHYSVQIDGSLKALNAPDLFLESLKSSVDDVVKNLVIANPAQRFVISFTRTGNDVDGYRYEPYFTTLDDGVLDE